MHQHSHFGLYLLFSLLIYIEYLLRSKSKIHWIKRTGIDFLNGQSRWDHKKCNIWRMNTLTEKEVFYSIISLALMQQNMNAKLSKAHLKDKLKSAFWHKKNSLIYCLNKLCIHTKIFKYSQTSDYVQRLST